MRKIKEISDVGAIKNAEYNDAAGGQKMIIVEPVVKAAVIATDTYQIGSYVKVTGTSYTLNLLGKDYSTSENYRPGNIAAQAGNVYLCKTETTGTFDSSKWELKSVKVIGPVTISAGALVSTGPWHNTVSAIGYICEDETRF